MATKGTQNEILPHACGTGKLVIGKPDSGDPTPCPSVQITGL